MKKYKKVYIEITNVCNLSCSFCPKTKRKQEFMSLELFEKIINEVKPFTKLVYLHVLGEPLLHKDLGAILKICSDKNVKVSITTNGTLIGNASETLLNSEILKQINFSLHSFEQEEKSYDYDAYIKGIFEFIEKALKQSKVSISLRLWNLKEIATPKNKEILDKIKKFFNIEYDLEEKLTPINGLKMVDRVFLNQAERFVWPNIKHSDTSNTGFCQGLRDQVGILVDGTVVPCCLDGEGTINLGNIKEASFLEIIDGIRAKNMYESFTNRKITEELCIKCTYRKRFER